MILLGSRAAQAWFSEFRQPKDWDVVATLKEIGTWAERNRDRVRRLAPTSERKYGAKLADGTRIEFEVIDPGGSTQMLVDLASRFRPVEIPGGVAKAAIPQLLWLTKRAHAIWPIRWDKTMADLHWLRSRAPVAVADLWAYHDVRRAEHAGRMSQRRVNLDMTNDAFFAKSAKAARRVVDHDTLHEIVKYGERPLYESFKTDPNRASLNRSMFESAPLLDRLRLVREEAMAIALERYVIPGVEREAEPAYERALQRICTTLTSGWFRDFAVDHWPLVRTPDRDFVALWRSVSPVLLSSRSISGT